MDADLFLVAGLILLGFSLPSIVSAFSEGRAPRLAAIVLLVGGTLVVLALNEQPYTIDGVAKAFARVVGRFIN
jgi:flagellar biosynthesis protein FliR